MAKISGHEVCAKRIGSCTDVSRLERNVPHSSQLNADLRCICFCSIKGKYSLSWAHSFFDRQTGAEQSSAHLRFWYSQILISKRTARTLWSLMRTYRPSGHQELYGLLHGSDQCSISSSGIPLGACLLHHKTASGCRTVCSKGHSKRLANAKIIATSTNSLRGYSVAARSCASERIMRTMESVCITRRRVRTGNCDQHQRAVGACQVHPTA